jgi:hypothetical protein
MNKSSTNIVTEGEFTKIYYHNTPVVSFDSKAIYLDSGAQFTKTTKARMNEASKQFGLNFHVQQIEGRWIVSRDGKILCNFDKSDRVNFLR